MRKVSTTNLTCSRISDSMNHDSRPYVSSIHCQIFFWAEVKGAFYQAVDATIEIVIMKKMNNEDNCEVENNTHTCRNCLNLPEAYFCIT